MTTTSPPFVATPISTREVQRRPRRPAIGASLVLAGFVAGYGLHGAFDHSTRSDAARPEVIATSGQGLGEALSVDYTVPVVAPVGDAGLGVVFAPAAEAAAWAPIRYSATPGLALILSDRYPSGATP